MSFLLDTNAVSEWTKPAPNVGFMTWLDGVDEDRVFISVVTLAELRFGVDVLPRGKRRARLDEWLRHDLPQRFEGRVLVVDAHVSEQWGALRARSAAIGRTAAPLDACIAAIALVGGLTVVTRNARDFAALEVSTLSPWS